MLITSINNTVFHICFIEMFAKLNIAVKESVSMNIFTFCYVVNEEWCVNFRFLKL
jgi:hypothetical protein